MSDEQKKHVEKIVNEKIIAALPVGNIIMPKIEAEKTGARHFFAEKYGDQISIYYIGSTIEKAYSKEFCGGPHVKNTLELAGPEGNWRFKITKEEAVSSGIRRIKAVLS
jgi:alanyl-tRNA synthetase